MTNSFIFFFFNDTATTEIYTLSLHDALPIFRQPLGRPEDDVLVLRPLRAARRPHPAAVAPALADDRGRDRRGERRRSRSEEDTSALHSRSKLLCPPLLGKKNTKKT